MSQVGPGTPGSRLKSRRPIGTPLRTFARGLLEQDPKPPLADDAAAWLANKRKGSR